MSYAGAHSNFTILVLRHRSVGPWSTTTTQFLSSNSTLPYHFGSGTSVGPSLTVLSLGSSNNNANNITIIFMS